MIPRDCRALLLSKCMCRWGTATISNQWLDLLEQVAVLEMVAVPGLAKPRGVVTRVQAPVSDRRMCCRPLALDGNGSQSLGGFLPRIATVGGLGVDLFR